MTASTSTLSTEGQTCFKFKASFAPCTILQMIQYDLMVFSQQLSEAISRAPNFFIGSPVVIDLDRVKNFGALDFSQIKKIMLENGLVPVGVRGGSEEQAMAAATAGLPKVSIGKASPLEPSTPVKKEKNEEPIPPPAQTTKLITTPIRSGMQVYAKGGDLIVTSHVSPGAELLADGHIHIYGALRGRALAGVQGNGEARIFCQSLDAELVSIAGYYLTKEDMQALPKQNGMMQIYLENEHVRIG